MGCIRLHGTGARRALQCKCSRSCPWPRYWSVAHHHSCDPTLFRLGSLVWCHARSLETGVIERKIYVKKNQNSIQLYFLAHSPQNILSRCSMITIVAYDTSWPEAFIAVAQPLRTALGELALRIDHIGSTSVPGLAAKDVIDVQVTLKDFSSAPQLVSALGS